MASQKLVIVESPTKARTIRKFLGDEYRVEASMGHVRDLPANAEEIPKQFKGNDWARLGVNIEQDFEPLYIIPASKKKIVSELRKALKDADELYLATDEDREGESIGWHLLQVLEPSVPTRRMVFHEITKEAIQHAIDSPREIDESLVYAQEARRVLDRLVGYTVSPLLWKKVKPKLSAGRVQSVAVRMLVLRERERIAFVPAEYWDIKATFEASGVSFDGQLASLDGIRLAHGGDFDKNTGKLEDGKVEGKDVVLLGGDRTKKLSAELEKATFSVESVERRESKRRPYAPFTTSTLQQEANRKLNMGARQTMSIAQRLYERGFITYMRTDSVNLSDQAIKGARDKISREYGDNYLSPKPRRFSTKSKGAQEAHEAIRPSGSGMPTSKELKLSGIDARLYELIWKRMVATQMADATIAFTNVSITTTTSEGEKAEFRASGREVVFPGFLRAYVEGADDPAAALDDQNNPLPALREDQTLPATNLDPSGHETRAPARYTEATLVKALEAAGIGRPSTYASIIDTIQNRGYVVANNKQLVPTFTAMAVTRLLEQTHANVVDLEFTADMEKQLDEITSSADSRAFLAKIYKDDVLDGVTTGEALDAKAVCTLTYEKIENVHVRVGRYGPYLEMPQEDSDKPRRVSIPDQLPPADLTPELVAELIEKDELGDVPLGEDPETGLQVFALQGPYGPYLQLGEQEEDSKKKPKRVSIPKERKMEDIELAEALDLLALPRTIGQHPEDDKVVKAGIGRYGPYVLHNRVYASLKKEDNVLSVGMERALLLLKEKKEKRGGREPMKELGEHPEEGGPVNVYDGRYGPYVKYKRVNATIPDGIDAKKITLEEALELVAAKSAKKTKKKAPKKKTAAKKKTTAKKPAAKKTAAKKAPAKKKAATKEKTTAKKTTAKKPAAKKPAAKKKATAKKTDDE